MKSRMIPTLLPLLVAVTVCVAQDQKVQAEAANQLLAQAEQLAETKSADSLRKAIDKYQEGLLLYRAAGSRRMEALTLDSIGDVYKDLGDKQKALEFYNQALPIYRAVHDRSGEGYVLYSLASVYEHLGQKQKALEHYNESLSIMSELGNRLIQAVSLGSIGRVYRDLDERQKALEFYYQSLAIIREIRNRGLEAATLSNIGRIYNEVGEPRKALEFFNQALPFIRAENDRGFEAITLNNIGFAHSHLGELRQALEFYNQALTICQAIGDRTVEATSFNNIGAIYEGLGERQRALEFYNQALPIRKALGDRVGEATALNNIAKVYSVFGEKRKALELYNQALPLLRAAGDRRVEATTLNNIGMVYSDLGEQQKALEFCNQALSIREAIGDRTGIGIDLNNLGSVHAALGENQKALDFYNQALATNKAVGDRDGEGTTLNNLAAFYERVGERQKALELYNQALLIRRAVGNRGGEATTLSNIGLVFSVLSEWQKALEFYSQALPIRRAVGDRGGEATTLNNIGAVYSALGEGEKALEYFNQALTILKEIGDRSTQATTLINIAGFHRKLGEPKRALEFYNQALSISQAIGNRETESTALNNLGVVYHSLGENQKALNFYSQALIIRRAIHDRVGEASTLSSLGSAYVALGENQKALDFYHEALPILRAVEDRIVEANTFDKLMRLWKNRNRGLAISYGKQSINLYQQLRGNITTLEKAVQRTFLESVEDSYSTLTGLLISDGRFPEAQQVLNLFKDQQFFDFNRDAQKQVAALALTPRETLTIERYGQKTKQVAVVGRQLDELKRQIGGRQPNVDEAAQLQQLESQLKTAANEFFAVIKQAESEFNQPSSEKDKVGEIADTRELQSALRQLKEQTGQSAVAIYTLVGTDDYSALIISVDNIAAITQPIKGDALDEKALQLWALLQSPRYDPTPLAQELYTTIFKPLEAQLPKGTSTILWSLDLNLRYLPMAALHDGQQYLVERFNHVVFTRADSERLLRSVSARWTGLGLGSSRPHTVEVLGDKISFSALPGVTEELRAIFRQEISPTGLLEGEVLPDARFTKAAMLAALKQKRPLVHISSHFSFRPGDEARSFLLLGDGTALTLEEMKQQLDLFAGVELLTLSACNTAAQQAGNGREIDGFAELAQRLGAGSVMATLWPVADNSTPWLMREFYQTRQTASGYTKAEAFRRAQLALLSGTAQTKPLPESQKGPSSAVKIVIGARGSKRDGAGTRADVVYVAAKNAPTFKRDDKKPFAHPYYWAPFILIGNWK